MRLPKIFRKFPVLAALMLVVCLVVPVGAALADPSFVNNQFQAKWQRADKPVQDGTSKPSRSWLWGPEGFNQTGSTTEAYAESPGGTRAVQYFDKARMELNNPSAGLVTNGLLVIEMISGREATGDSANLTRKPADIPVAGDSVNNDGPTYASLAGVASLNLDKPATNKTGQQVEDALDKDGPGLAKPEVAEKAKYVYFEPTLKHNIPDVFWNFMNQKGNIFEGGKLTDSQPILGSNADAPWLDATGYPLTDAYWTSVTVGGVAKDVLMQAFQRRVLTFTPDNPVQYQVEMGNVGRHYFTWRYSTAYDIPTTPTAPTTPIAPKPPTVPNSDNVKSCSDLPASTARTPFNCGPAGMPVKIAADYPAGEVVTIDRYDPGNNLVQSFQGTTNPKGQFEIILDTWPTNTQGFWTYKLKGKTSGKELVLYVWLEQPSTKPTIRVNPASGNTHQIFDFLITGFKPTDFVHGGIVAPDGQSFGGSRLYGTRVGSGGGLVVGFRFGDEPPFNQKGTWTYTITANDLSDGYRFCSVQITVTD